MNGAVRVHAMEGRGKKREHSREKTALRAVFSPWMTVSTGAEREKAQGLAKTKSYHRTEEPSLSQKALWTGAVFILPKLFPNDLPDSKVAKCYPTEVFRKELSYASFYNRSPYIHIYKIL